jgi:hypothetical protein
MASNIVKRQRLRGVVSRVHRIGIELEGGWDRYPEGYEIEHDGSVKFDPPFTVHYGDDGSVVYRSTEDNSIIEKSVVQRFIVPAIKGEIVSHPMKPDEFEEWLREYYPPHINDTCGLHIHMSFSHKLHYQRLMTPDYTEHLLRELRKFAINFPKDHTIWKRLNNKDHDHCAHIYRGEGQVGMKRKDYHSRGTDHSRYTAVNYCYGLHKTLECRLLPMFTTPDEAISAINFVIDTTNRFLSVMKRREYKEKIHIRLRPEVFREFEALI